MNISCGVDYPDKINNTLIAKKLEIELISNLISNISNLKEKYAIRG